MKAEFAAMKGAVADPFTRRHSRPTLVTKVCPYMVDLFVNLDSLTSCGGIAASAGTDF